MSSPVQSLHDQLDAQQRAVAAIVRTCLQAVAAGLNATRADYVLMPPPAEQDDEKLPPFMEAHPGRG